MKMKALVKAKPEPGIWLEDVDVPQIGINDVLIKINKNINLRYLTCISITGMTGPKRQFRFPCTSGTNLSARLLKSATMCMTSNPVTLFQAKDIWSADAAATVWPVAATCA